MKATLIITTVFCSFLSLTSCKNTKEVTQQELTTLRMEQKSTLLEKGYTAATIVQTKEEGYCEWTIKADNGKIYESLVMNDTFKKDAMQVYFKFIRQRRQSKCTNANPVEITEMIEAK